MLSLGLFLPMVLTVLTVSWHNHDVRNIGFALLFSWAASNAISIWLPFDYRPLMYPVLEVVVGLMAAGGWLVMRFAPDDSRPAEGQLFAMLIVLATLQSAAASVNYSITAAPGYADRYLFVLWTNICFSIECILVGTWGIRDAFARAAGVARFLRGPRLGPQPAGPVAASEEE